MLGGSEQVQFVSLILGTAFRGTLFIYQQFTAFILDLLNCCILNDWFLTI